MTPNKNKDKDMSVSDEYNKALSAREEIKAAKTKLRNEEKAIAAKIDCAKSQIPWLETSYLPLEDVKEAIIQILYAGGELYNEQFLRNSLSSLATNALFGYGVSIDKYGKALAYLDIEKCLEGSLSSFSFCQVLNTNKEMFDDRVFFGLLFKSIEPSLRDVLGKMKPSEFGYDLIGPSEIGPPLNERRKMILEIKERISLLQIERDKVLAKLSALEG